MNLEWQYSIGDGFSLNACCYGDKVSRILRLDSCTSKLVKSREMVMDRVSSKAGPYAAFIRSSLNSVLPAEVPTSDVVGTTRIWTVTISVEANANVTLIFIHGLTKDQIGEWFENDQLSSH